MGKDEYKQDEDEVDPEILKLFGDKQNVPAGFRRNYHGEGDLARDPQGRPIHVDKPENPKDRFD